jgi:DNA end-binding protein Ku
MAAQRYYWKGFLKLSLVTCPVQLSPATSDGEKIKFHTINKKTGNRIVSRYIDAETGDVVEEDIKGYEDAPGHFVLLEDEELEAVALESEKTIDIDTFVPAGSIPWIYLDQPYFLTPDGKVGDEAYAVIREAMNVSDVVGISHVILNRRERAVMLEPKGKGIIAWTLRYGDEVRLPAEHFSGIEKTNSDGASLGLAAQLIKQRSKPWSPAMVKDPVQDQLRSLIEGKRKTQRAKLNKAKGSAPAKDDSGKVVDLFQALKKSLAQGTAKPARR